jgi:monothiol glutaredoxin
MSDDILNEFDPEAVLAQIDEQINNNPVMLYMKGTPKQPQCGFSNRAVQILNACGVEFASVNIFEHPDIRAMLPKRPQSKWPTFPQLFINGELVGGSDIMLEEYESGELQTKLEKVV